jgi:hypothetical protein
MGIKGLVVVVAFLELVLDRVRVVQAGLLEESRSGLSAVALGI